MPAAFRLSYATAKRRSPSAAFTRISFARCKRRAMQKVLLLGIALLAMQSSGAQTYPARPVAIVVPFSAGGPTDTIARIMAERMGRSLGQPVVVENTTGAGGSIAVGRIARAAPDGYMLSIGHFGTHVISGATYQLQYDLLRDLEPVAMLATNPQILVSKTAV